MGVVLEIRSGAGAGKAIALTKGKSVTVGRAEGKAEFALAEDTFMSGLHFAVECGPSGCRVVDRKSSNGTFLNGAKIQDAMLANGDEIKAGKTVFHVRIVADAKIAEMNLPQPAETLAASRPSLEAEPIARPSSRPSRDVEAAAPRSSRDVLAGRARNPEPSLRGNEHAVEANALPGGAGIDEVPPREKPKAVLPNESAAGAAPGDVGSASIGAASDFSPIVEPSRKSAQPNVEERPRSPEIPSAPSAHASVPREAEGRERMSGAIPQQPTGLSGSRRAAAGRTFAFTVMGWSFPAAPADWQVQEGFGLQRAGESEFPSSVAATEEALAGITLQQFVESQISMLRGYLRDPKIEPTMPPQVDGADEVMGMDVRHATKDGTELAYRHIYARSNSSVGILTVTTLAAEFPKVIESLQPILDGAAFRGRSE